MNNKSIYIFRHHSNLQEQNRHSTPSSSSFFVATSQATNLHSTAPMTSTRPPPSKSLDIDLTIVSAKHLKNVNWKNGDLKPYVVFWVDPDRRLATKSDDSGSTSPVWNERFTLPLTRPLHDSFLTFEIFHSKPSETPKPLVGSLRIPLKDLDEHEDSTHIRKFTLTRPSGRPEGKIHLKLGLLGRPVPPSAVAPPSVDYVSSCPSLVSYLPPNPIFLPSARDCRGFSPSPSPEPYTYSSHPDAYPGYYSGYYSSAPPPPPPRPFFDRPPASYGGPAGPSAPLDYSSYERPKSGKTGMVTGAGLAVGAVAGGLGAIALEEGLKYEEEKIAGRADNDILSRDDAGTLFRDY